MRHEIKLPQLELNMEDVAVQRWLVSVGDLVNEEDPILEVETQKATVEVPAPRRGYIRQLCVEIDQEISENALLAVMTDDADESLDESLDELPDETASTSTAILSHDASPSVSPCGLSTAVASVFDGAVRATPLARKIAHEHGIDLPVVTGSGPIGRIQRRDVDAYLLARSSPSAPVSSAIDSDGDWTDISPTRLALIGQMQKAVAEIPQINVSRQLDVTPLTQKIEGVTFTHRLIRAVAMSLEKHPGLRSVIQDKRIRIMPVSVAVAMETPTGLVAPVIRDAATLSVSMIAQQVRDFVERATRGRLKRDELTNGPFAISNLGMLGVDMFTPLVFHGQTAVLAVARAVDAPAGRRVTWFTLAADHRVVDGAEAARFLQTLQDQIDTL